MCLSEGGAQKCSQKSEMHAKRRKMHANSQSHIKKRCGSHVLKGERCTAHSHPEKIGALAGNQEGNLEKPIILRRALRK